jgi:hypothetical protein
MNPNDVRDGGHGLGPDDQPARSALSGVPKADYAGSYESDMLEQYKLYVEMMDNISGRRQDANTFFLAVNTALVSLLGIVGRLAGQSAERVWHVLACVAGLVLCYSWYRLLQSYRGLNSGKCRVIGLIEEHLPLRPYRSEWAALGNGKDPKLYKPFTGIEVVVPWVFLGLYAALAVFAFVVR